MIERLFARARNRAGLGDLAGKGDRVGEQAVLARQPVDQPNRLRLFRTDRIALRRHLQCGFDTRDARQALGSPRPGQQPQLDLWRAELRGGHRDPVVAGECDFASPAKRGAVDRGDDRLRTRLDQVDQRGERWLLHGFAELRDVRASKKGAAFAADDHRRHVIRTLRFSDARRQPPAAPTR